MLYDTVACSATCGTACDPNRDLIPHVGQVHVKLARRSDQIPGVPGIPEPRLPEVQVG